MKILEQKTMIKDCVLIEPLFCKEDDSVVEVAKKLRGHLIRYIYVVDKNDTPVGVISTTDINNRVVAEGKNPTSLKAKEIMTKPIHSFEETDDVNKAYKACVKNEIATCPVTSKGKLVGLVSVHELLRKITNVEDKNE